MPVFCGIYYHINILFLSNFLIYYYFISSRNEAMSRAIVYFVSLFFLFSASNTNNCTQLKLTYIDSISKWQIWDQLNKNLLYNIKDNNYIYLKNQSFVTIRKLHRRIVPGKTPAGRGRPNIRTKDPRRTAPINALKHAYRTGNRTLSSSVRVASRDALGIPSDRFREIPSARQAARTDGSPHRAVLKIKTNNTRSRFGYKRRAKLILEALRTAPVPSQARGYLSARLAKEKRKASLR